MCKQHSLCATAHWVGYILCLDRHLPLIYYDARSAQSKWHRPSGSYPSSATSEVRDPYSICSSTGKRKAPPIKEEDDEIDIDLDEEMKRKQGELKVGTVFSRLSHIRAH